MSSKVENIVREQAAYLFPELSKGNVQVIWLEPEWRLHQSVIYQFCITGDRGFSKDIVVKQRIFNPNYRNDVVVDTLKEYENLRLLEERGKGKFRVVRALGMVQDKGLLFMERVPGKRFSDILKEFNRRKPSPQRFEEIKGCFSASGQWLKAFHESGATGRTEKVPVDECLSEAKRIIAGLGWRAKFSHLESALDQMQKLKNEAGLEIFPVVLKHDDFHLRNILFENGQPVVGDVGGCRLDIALHDICDFLIVLFSFNIRYPFSRFTRLAQVGCAIAFLDSYFSDQRKPWPAIKFHLMLCAIRQTESILLRNRFSFPRTVWAALYYRNLIEWLAKWDIDQ
jgi:hypothetical protein